MDEEIAEENILGIIDHAYVGNVKDIGTGLVLTVKTYLYGDHKFVLPLEDMDSFIKGYNIDDISILFDVPIILSGSTKTMKFRIKQLCKTRRMQ
jgi:hypothetical protein